MFANQEVFGVTRFSVLSANTRLWRYLEQTVVQTCAILPLILPESIGSSVRDSENTHLIEFRSYESCGTTLSNRKVTNRVPIAYFFRNIRIEREQFRRTVILQSRASSKYSIARLGFSRFIRVHDATRVCARVYVFVIIFSYTCTYRNSYHTWHIKCTEWLGTSGERKSGPVHTRFQIFKRNLLSPVEAYQNALPVYNRSIFSN